MGLKQPRVGTLKPWTRPQQIECDGPGVDHSGLFEDPALYTHRVENRLAIVVFFGFSSGLLWLPLLGVLWRTGYPWIAAAFTVGGGLFWATSVWLLSRHLRDISVYFVPDSTTLEFRNCFYRRGFQPGAGSAVVQEESVQRIDVWNESKNRQATVHTTEGTAAVSGATERFDELIRRLDSIALENDHPELQVTMEQLKWRKLGIAVAAFIVVGVPIAVFCWWYVTR